MFHTVHPLAVNLFKRNVIPFTDTRTAGLTKNSYRQTCRFGQAPPYVDHHSAIISFGQRKKLLEKQINE